MVVCAWDHLSLVLGVAPRGGWCRPGVRGPHGAPGAIRGVLPDVGVVVHVLHPGVVFLSPLLLLVIALSKKKG